MLDKEVEMLVTEDKKTSLYDEHLKLNAKIVPFGGWAMPVQYEGIIKEHNATREFAGLFDVSHMGEIFVSGKDALNYLKDTGIIIKIHNLSIPSTPLAINSIDNQFKVYPTDIGMLVGCLEDGVTVMIRSASSIAASDESTATIFAP